ncbi:FkbM family methyltransferase [Candidatus Nanosalina sp. VS9-1]|uniref:FkbM family methyltransferase n=1 Tax=Candidatus Nanosalina sp. VS9-1 TaxID=3388566 RepID=UPI0039E0BEEC
MPLRKGVYNGVEVPSARFFQPSLDLKELNNETYEKGILNSLEKNVSSGDEVIIIGGGLGVSAVHAAEITSPENVSVYEASGEQVEKIRRTLRFNEKEDISVHHKIVGEKGNLFGEEMNAEVMPVEDLPECDVLEIDVEGAELKILDSLEIRPEVLIVETHGVFDSPTEKVKEKILELGYEIESIEEAEEDEEIQERDVKVITAVWK